MSATKAANYQIGFPQGPLTNDGRTLTAEWQRFLLWLFNRTGGAQGIDGRYVAEQGAQNTSDLTAVEKTAEQALANAQEALDEAQVLLAETRAAAALLRKTLAKIDELAILSATTSACARAGQSDAGVIFAITRTR